jgi:hypothetical protein
VRDDEISNKVFHELYDYDPATDQGPEDPFVRNKTKAWQAYENVAERVGLTPERVKEICRATGKRGEKMSNAVRKRAHRRKQG